MRLAACLACSVLFLAAGGCTGGKEKLARYPEPIFDTKPGREITQPPALMPQPQPQPKPVEPRPAPGSSVVVVDAGHGGKDPGARGLASQDEKQINLAIALRLVQRLEEKGARVVTTRNSDRFIELNDRAALADRTNTDLFVSIHADSAKRTSASGVTVYVARNAGAESQRAADRIVGALRRAGIECNGVSRAGFRVLVDHSRPAVLVECGFLTNRHDARLLTTATHQEALAAALAQGIAEHLGL